MKTNSRIAIFASGNGSNAQRIADYFKEKGGVEIVAIYCNKPGAFVLERAKSLDIPSVLFDRNTFYNTGEILQDLVSREAEWIILAGFLWLIPPNILERYAGRIINIHPALLPKYGGKGMYGSKVHEAVVAAGEKESGITIHLVNENYDEGQVLFQAVCQLEAGETPDSLAARIHALEYAHFPVVIEKILNQS